MKVRSFFLASFLVLLSLLTFSCSRPVKLFVGGFTRGNEKSMSVFNFSLKDGSLKLESTIDAGPSPSFFCFSGNGTRIYAANEVMTFNGERAGGVTTLVLNSTTGQWENKGSMAVPFGGPCHISLSSDEGYLLFASYSSSSAAVVKLGEDGIPAEVTDTIVYSSDDTTLVSHPHKILADPSGKHIYLTDLGLDRIMIYTLDTSSGKLLPAEVPSVSVPKGSGPRHFTFNSDGSLLYLINELGSSVMVFRVEANGGLTSLQTLSTVDKAFTGKNFCAEIVMGKSGKYIYGSNRGENTIVVFRVGSDRLLTLAGRTSCGGNWPRNFNIDSSGRFLLAGNERSDNISVFRINQVTGIPEGPVNTVEVKAPACLRFKQ